MTAVTGLQGKPLLFLANHIPFTLWLHPLEIDLDLTWANGRGLWKSNRSAIYKSDVHRFTE